MVCYVGIDLGLKGMNEACLLEENGHRLRFRFSNLPDSLAQLSDWVSRQNKTIGGFVMEPTGSSWIPVTHWLIAQGYTVYLLKPDKSYALRQFYHKHTKTDLLDAEVLAKVPLVDSEGIFPYQVPSEKVTALKQLGKTRQLFVDLAAAQEKRIQALCDQLLPGWRRQLKGKQLVGEMGKAFFQEYTDLSRVEKAKEEAFYQVLASASSPAGLKKISIFRSLALKAHAFHLKTHGEQNTRLFYESLWQELKPLLELIRFAEKQAEQLEKEMEKIYLELDPERTLETHVGIGKISAFTILPYAAQVERFSNIRQFRAYAGVCPKKRQSGMREAQGLSMTKAGPKRLKRALYLAADAARKGDPEFAKVYHRLREKGKHHNKALIALAAKMADRIYSVMRRKNHKLKKEEGREKVIYELRDFDGKKISKKEALELIHQKFGRNLNEAKKKKREECLKKEAV